MNEIIKLSEADRRKLFIEASARLGMVPEIVEKDFWVCWTLNKMFSISAIKPHLIFKGGTSLSKVYKIIDRFSEDVDVSLSREWLGFGADLSPEKASTRKESERRIEALVEECKRRIADVLTPELSRIVEALLPAGSWKLEIDPQDAQTLLFYYPSSTIAGEEKTYIPPIVRIELGARSDHWPVEEKVITPYAADVLGDAIKESQVQVRVLSAERTFWEKATILHAEAHRPADKVTPSRFSRHYYDLFKLAQSDICPKAITMNELRERVVEHKDLFFRSGWARYNLAVPGSFKLIPDERRLKDLSADYRSMQVMIFKDLPSFDEIISGLSSLEQLLNQK